MNAWPWIVGVLAGLAYGLPSTIRNWRREHALTAHCLADEQAKTDALKQRLTGGAT